MKKDTQRDFNEIHLVVDHPVCGQFVARKLTKPEELEDDFVDRAVNNLSRWLRDRGGWGNVEPAVLVRRI